MSSAMAMAVFPGRTGLNGQKMAQAFARRDCYAAPAVRGERSGAMQAQARRREDEPAPSEPAAGRLVHDPLRRDRSDGIDLLRAIFALWVVLAHLIPWSVFAHGQAAVPSWLADGAH